MSDSTTISDTPDPDLGQDIEDVAPEVEVDTPDAVEEPKHESRQVPLAELIRERNARKAAVDESRQLRELQERGNERLQELIRTLQPKPPAPPVPDLNTDPVGHFQHENAQLRQEMAEMKAWRQQQEQGGQARSQEHEFVSRYNDDAAVFSSKHPDFGQAYEHVKESLVRDFLEAGYSFQDAIVELQDQERKIVQRAFKDGRSPSEAVYKLAKSRGFAGAKQDGAARLETMQRGQAAARSVAGPSRGEGYSGLTLADLANMSTDDFAKVPDKITRRLLGG